MTAQLDEDKVNLVSRVLQQADDLVTMVIKGDGKAVRSALDLARTLSDIRRKYGSLKLFP